MSRPFFKRNEDSSIPFSSYVFMAFLIGVLYLFYLVIRPFLTDLFVALVLAMIFFPVYKRLVRLFKGLKILSAFLTVFIMILAFLIPVFLLSGVVTSQSLDLYQKLSKGLQDGSIKKNNRSEAGLF
jgi:predicted PurR-regulated permease PerM